MNTRKIVISLDAGMAGTDSYEFWEVPETATDDELNELCWERAKDHAEMYGIYPRDEYLDTEDYDDDDESYSINIEGSFEDYNPDEHDGHRVGNDTSWETY
jgi:hypothetical protein